jgi:dipeptidase D
MTFVSELEPRPVWRHFDKILTIPRPSKGEEAMRRHVVSVAEEHGLEVRRDEVGNVVVVKPAAAGREGVPVTVLQGHLDMVQEKNSGTRFDFASDALRPARDGEYLTAEGTTLGSDNGIGVAAMLALMEADDVAHGPLELLFTVDEETGLTGAAGLGSDLLTGRRLLNLDTEEEGAVYVGCAGGGDSQLRLPLAQGPAPSGSSAIGLHLDGLKGGHSGVDIHLQRGNAIKLLVRVLWAAWQEVPFVLSRLAGGTAHNAIPREAFATLVVAAGREEALRAALEREMAVAAAEVRPVDPDAALHLAALEVPREAWDEATTVRALALLAALPHGVMAMSYDIPDLVETSTNLAVVKEEGGRLGVLMSSRSSTASAIADLRRRIRAAGTLAGAEVEDTGGYPGWKPDLDSELLATVAEVHRRVLGAEPRVKAIHAGLETGIIGEKYPGMDMVSIGPQIEYPHSPDERVHVGSVERFWKFLRATLEELARPAS